eukprot:3504557-Prymnesium_polylepis.1
MAIAAAAATRRGVAWMADTMTDPPLLTTVVTRVTHTRIIHLLDQENKPSRECYSGNGRREPWWVRHPLCRPPMPPTPRGSRGRDGHLSVTAWCSYSTQRRRVGSN